MNSQTKENIESLSVLSAIGQLTTITAPFLYLLGRNYASWYFDALGCNWVISFLSFQETLLFSIPAVLPILGGMFLSLQLLLDGKPFSKIMKYIIYFFLIILALTIAIYFFSSFSLSDAISSIFPYFFFVLFGAYIADIFIAVKIGEKTYINFALAWTIGALSTVYIMSGIAGSNAALKALDNPQKTFPLLTKGPTNGVPYDLRLVSKVGDKYLLMDQSKKNPIYKLESNIDSYTIQYIKGKN